MHSQTCMVGLLNLHGWTQQLAWFSFLKCMVQLPKVQGWAFQNVWFGFPECMDGSPQALKVFYLSYAGHRRIELL